MSDPMHDWAQLYASLGWPVFPLHVPVTTGPKSGAGHATCSCGDDTCTSQGKHPRTPNGVSGATTDPETITRWWATWPGANIGVATGVAFDVLDLDGPQAVDLFDYATPDDVRPNELHGPMVRTGNGVHMYVQPTGQGNRVDLVATGSGIDWRGAGGYVVAPPSLHYSGTAYEWVEGRGADDVTPAAVPDWLRVLVETRRPAPGTVAAAARKRVGLDKPAPLQRADVRCSDATTAYGRAVLGSQLHRLNAAIPGNRNTTLNTCALVLGSYVAGGEIAARDALDVLYSGARHMGLNVEPKKEADLTIRSGFDAGLRSPKSAPPHTVQHVSKSEHKRRGVSA